VFFIKNISILDGALIGLLTGVIVNYNFSLHPALSFLLGLFVFFLVVGILGISKIGFWIISLLISLCWSAIFALVYSYNPIFNTCEQAKRHKPLIKSRFMPHF
jgi:hypothetical protein